MKLHYFSLFLLLIILELSTTCAVATQGNVSKKPLNSLPPEALLSIDHYDRTCPDAEGIISQKVAAWVKKDPTLAPAIIRLHFHDCAIRVITQLNLSLYLTMFSTVIFFFPYSNLK